MSDVWGICDGWLSWYESERDTGLPFRHESGCNGECVEQAAVAFLRDEA